MIESLPHNRFKLPLCVACTAFGIYLLVTGATVLGAIIIALSVPAVVAIAAGRYPWWLRAPADRWEAAWKRRRSN